jgi:formylglycine-generating enzyme required for sulfatase activity
MDKYEASVWRIPEPTGANKGLVRKVREGTASLADLTAASPPATQIGTTIDNWPPCGDTGQNCANDVYAVSLPGVIPTAYTTWFQAVEACTNSGKRLPSNAEWQAAANGSPDPGPDNGTTDCNTASAGNPVATGSRTSCVSARGAFDMVGNLFEWVAEWVPPSTNCPAWLGGSDDHNCFAGANTGYGPAAIVRGGYVGSGTGAGPLMVNAGTNPDAGDNDLGFRCVR